MQDKYTQNTSYQPSSIASLDESINDVLTGEQLLNRNIEKIECLVEPIFPKTGLACLAGTSDTGKSMLLRQLALELVGGKDDFLGHKFHATHRSCIFVSTEDNDTETSVLLKKQFTGKETSALRNLRFCFHPDNALVKVKQLLEEAPVDLVIIDCFSDCFNGNLNDAIQIRTYLNQFATLAFEYKALFLFLHHTGKRTETLSPNKSNLLGSQGLEAKMRVVIELRSDPNNANLKHLCIVKGNYLPAQLKSESLVLDFDENCLRFENTGTREPLKSITHKETQDPEYGKKQYLQALIMKEQGVTYDKIAAELGYKSKGSVAKLIEKGAKMGWSNDLKNEYTQNKSGG